MNTIDRLLKRIVEGEEPDEVLGFDEEPSAVDTYATVPVIPPYDPVKDIINLIGAAFNLLSEAHKVAIGNQQGLNDTFFMITREVFSNMESLHNLVSMIQYEQASTPNMAPTSSSPNVEPIPAMESVNEETPEKLHAVLGDKINQVDDTLDNYNADLQKYWGTQSNKPTGDVAHLQQVIAALDQTLKSLVPAYAAFKKTITQKV